MTEHDVEVISEERSPFGRPRSDEKGNPHIPLEDQKLHKMTSMTDDEIGDMVKDAMARYKAHGQVPGEKIEDTGLDLPEKANILFGDKLRKSGDPTLPGEIQSFDGQVTGYEEKKPVKKLYGED